ncbi:hypothetical protein HMPREF3185_01105 [Porphyromonas somerae]|uniref:Uncharacterized protein n=1 Tax=Porphyromonas somerae TaxID=322095 RepID=A0A134B897_9PORP|nr:hypothetical protein HMPREF3184_01105 [Porphyromonadaceae bacterium KA00676]KXB76168.1 hypothetical protein HMPREF3185_01105 [Porphyromonas somerae]
MAYTSDRATATLPKARDRGATLAPHFSPEKLCLSTSYATPLHRRSLPRSAEAKKRPVVVANGSSTGHRAKQYWFIIVTSTGQPAK